MGQNMVGETEYMRWQVCACFWMWSYCYVFADVGDTKYNFWKYELAGRTIGTGGVIQYYCARLVYYYLRRKQLKKMWEECVMGIIV